MRQSRRPGTPLHPFFTAVIRLLLPSWRFFDGPGAAVQPFYRWQNAGGIWSAWQPVLHFEQRRIWNLFWNPWGNEQLLQISFWSRFVEESQAFLENPDALKSTVSYRVCRALIVDRLKNLNAVAPMHFQFKIDGYTESGERAAVFVSETETA